MIRDMNEYSRKEAYEQASNIKKHIEAINYLKNSPITPEEFLVNPNLVEDTRQNALTSLENILTPLTHLIHHLNRIEMYDIAHLSGEYATAGMSVAIEGEINSSYFKHFKLKTDKSNSDVDMVSEILNRRLKHLQWPKPDLIVLDGGKPQLNAIIDIPEIKPIFVVALAKKDETLVIPQNNSYIEINLPKNHPGLLLLIRLRDEAHRFSRSLHHKYKVKSLTK